MWLRGLFSPQMHYFVLVLKFNCNPITLHCEIHLWGFEIRTELTILNNFVLFIPFSRPSVNMLSRTNSGTSPWGTSLATLLHHGEVLSYAFCSLYFKFVLICKEVVCLVCACLCLRCIASYPYSHAPAPAEFFHKGKKTRCWLHGSELGAKLVGLVF